MSPLLSAVLLLAAVAQAPAPQPQPQPPTSTQPPAPSETPKKKTGDQAAPQKPEDIKYVELEFGGSSDLSLDPDGFPAARFGVHGVKGVDLAKLVPHVWDVTSGSDHSAKLRSCFSASMDDVQTPAPAVVVRCQCPSLAVGTYAVTLGIESPGNEGVQKLPLQLKRNAVAVRTIAAQTIERIVRYPGAQPVIAPPALIIATTSAGTPLTGVSAEQIDPIVADTRQTTATVHFAGPVNTDTAGKAALPVSFTGRTPYGKSKTTIRVFANELAAPVDVALEIQTRLHEWLLFPAIVLGLLLGWVMRTVLKGRVERAKSRLAVDEQLDKIQAAETPDATLTATLAGIATTLRAALTGTPENVKTAVTNADTALLAAVADLKQRLKDQADAATTKSALIANRRALPSTIASILESAEPDVAAAREKIAAKDADGAKAALAVADQKLQGVLDAARNWVNAITPHANEAGTIDSMPAEYKAAFTASLAKLKTQLGAIKVDGTDTPAQVVTEVRAAFLVSTDEIERQELRPVLATAASVVNELNKKKKVDPATAATIDPAVAAIENAAKALADALDADADATLAPVAEVSALLGTMTQQLKTLGAANPKVAPELEAGHYLAAAKYISGTLLKAGTAMMFNPMTPTAAAESTSGVAPVTPPDVAKPSPTVVDRQRTMAELFRANAWQFGLSAVGITLAGFILLLPGFDGTWRGLLTAFFWGYAGDISVDAFTEAAKKYKPANG